MFTDLNVFRMAHAMAVHAGNRQAVIAQNVANVDTPGYRGRDLAPFAEQYGRSPDGLAMQATRPGHLESNRATSVVRSGRSAASEDPNGNSVSVEQQMLKAVEAKRQHDRALAIYKSSLNILRTSLGRG